MALVAAPSRMFRRIFSQRGFMKLHAKNGAVAIVGQIGGILGVLVGAKVLTSIATPNTVGEYNLIIGICALVEGVVLRPYSQYVMRVYHDAAQQDAVANFLRSARSRYLGFIALSVILVLMCQAISSYGVHRVSLIAGALSGIYIAGSGLLSFETGILVTAGRLVASNTISLIQRWSVPLLGCSAVWFWADRSTSLVAAAAVALLGLALAVRAWSAPAISTASDNSNAEWFADMPHFTLPLALVGIFSWITSVGDRYVLGRFMDPATVGIYSMSYGLVATPMLSAWGAVAQVLYPVLFGAAAKRSDSRLHALCGLQLCIVVCLLLAMLVVHFAGEGLALVFLGHRFQKGVAPLLFWITAGHGLLIMGMACDLFAMAGKKTGRIMVAYGISAIVNVVMNILLVPRFGMMGAAWATCATYGAYLAVMLGFVLVPLLSPKADAVGTQIGETKD